MSGHPLLPYTFPAAPAHLQADLCPQALDQASGQLLPQPAKSVWQPLIPCLFVLPEGRERCTVLESGLTPF